jgi:uridine kinase
VAIDGVSAAGKTTFFGHLTVFLAVDRIVALERGIARDAATMPDARERYLTRYFPDETRYLEEVDPESLADIVVDMNDLRRPRLDARAGRPA